MKMFSQGDIDKRGIKIMRDGKPAEISDFRDNDQLTATIVTTKPPRVMTEKEVQATLAKRWWRRRGRRAGGPAAAAAARGSTPNCGTAATARVASVWPGWMRHHQLASRRRRRFRATTDSRHPFPVAPNVLARQFAQGAPDRAWVTDITYMPTAEGWLYLAVILGQVAKGNLIHGHTGIDQRAPRDESAAGSVGALSGAIDAVWPGGGATSCGR